jgi:hypothetical protein
MPGHLSYTLQYTSAFPHILKPTTDQASAVDLMVQEFSTIHMNFIIPYPEISYAQFSQPPQIPCTSQICRI